MRSYSFEYKRGHEFYKIDTNGKITASYKKMSKEEINQVLLEASTGNITNLVETKDAMYITFNNDFEIAIKESRVLAAKNSLYSKYFDEIKRKVLAYVEYEKDMQEFFATRVEKGKTNLINREASKRIKGGQVLAASLSLVSLLSLNYVYNKIKGNEIEFLDDGPSIATSDFVKRDESAILYDNDKMEYYFQKVPDTLEYSSDFSIETTEDHQKKLAATIDFCGDSIGKYATRYGIPYNVGCALISQERPSIVDGKCQNPCQITYEDFINTSLTVPLYNEQGPTGETETIHITEDLLNTTDGNIQVALAYVRTCINMSDSLLTGIYSNNQGPNSLKYACEYYGVDINNYKGDTNSEKACELIRNYHAETKDRTWGDPNYLNNVFRYLEGAEDRENVDLTYFNSSGVLVKVTINNSRQENRGRI